MFKIIIFILINYYINIIFYIVMFSSLLHLDQYLIAAVITKLTFYLV